MKVPLSVDTAGLKQELAAALPLLPIWPRAAFAQAPPPLGS